MMMGTNAIIIIIITHHRSSLSPLPQLPSPHKLLILDGSPYRISPLFYPSFFFSFLIPTIVGPAVEAFGYQRIIFGSSPVSSEPSNAGDWYEIARESVAELGLEQEDIDAIFYSNAQSVYGLSSSA